MSRSIQILKVLPINNELYFSILPSGLQIRLIRELVWALVFLLDNRLVSFLLTYEQMWIPPLLALWRKYRCIRYQICDVLALWGHYVSWLIEYRVARSIVESSSGRKVLIEVRLSTQ